MIMLTVNWEILSRSPGISFVRGKLDGKNLKCFESQINEIFIFHTYSPTHRPFTHQPTEWLSSTYIKIEDQILKKFC